MKLEIMSEKRPSKVSGVYKNEADARGAVHALVANGNFEPDSVRITSPKDQHFAEKVEPDPAGIAQTLVRAHLVFGLSGLLLGLIVSGVLALFGPPLMQSNPVFTVMTLTLIFLFLGLIFAGFVGLRPDHDPLIEHTRHAIQSGCWAVVVHALDKREKYRAKSLMVDSAEWLYETR